ncbi:MAG: hypothetical protein AB7L70_19135 [Pyrinomonadaceae bacterium]
MSELFNEVADQGDKEAQKKSLLERFGDGTTFDVEKLAAGKIESDNYIRRLEAEQAELRKAVQKQATVDEILTQIRQAQPQVPPVQQPTPPPAKPDNDPADVAKLVEEAMKARESQNTLKSNRQISEEAVVKAWGADAQLQLSKKARELNVSLAELSKLASESPQIFLRAVGLDKPVQPANIVAPRGAQVAQSSDPNRRNKTHYDRLKSVNPSEYFSQKVQRQMYKDAMEQGESFFS